MFVIRRYTYYKFKLEVHKSYEIKKYRHGDVYIVTLQFGYF